MAGAAGAANPRGGRKPSSGGVAGVGSAGGRARHRCGAGNRRRPEAAAQDTAAGDAAPKAAAEPDADFGEGSSSEDSSSPAVPMAAKKSAAAKAPPEPPFPPGATPPRDAPKAPRVAKSEPSSSSSEEKKKKRKDKKKAKAKKEKGGKKRKHKRSRAKAVKPSTSSDSSSSEAKDEDASEYSDWEGDDDYWGGAGREKLPGDTGTCFVSHAPLCDSPVVWSSHALSTKVRTFEAGAGAAANRPQAPLWRRAAQARRGLGSVGQGQRQGQARLQGQEGRRPETPGLGRCVWSALAVIAHSGRGPLLRLAQRPCARRKTTARVNFACASGHVFAVASCVPDFVSPLHAAREVAKAC